MDEDYFETGEQALAYVLNEIVEQDTNHDARYRLVFEAMCVALEIGYKAGIRIDPNEPEWPVVYIELPDLGQVSWHMPQLPQEWDGHSTEEKFDRIRQFSEAHNG